MTSPDRERLTAALQEGVSAPVLTSLEARRAYSSNFGGMVCKMPALVVRTASEEEVTHVLRLARQAQCSVAIRGSGHSFGAHGLCAGGIVVLNQAGREEIRMLNQDLVEVSSRTSWGALEQWLNRHGRAMPVLTNELGVSVGGTLSVGGYGEGTVAHYGQIDLVVRMKLILPDGSSVWCSATENSELFRYGLGSLGQLGFIEKVVLRTLPYHPRSHIFIYTFPDLLALVNATLWLAESDEPIDFFSGQHYQSCFVATYGRRASGRDAASEAAPPGGAQLGTARAQVAMDWPLRSLREERRTRWDPEHCFVWADYTVSLDHLERFVSFLTQNVLGDAAYQRYNGRTLMLALRRPERKTHFPFEPITPAMSGIALGFGVYFKVPRAEPEGLRRVQGLQRRALEQCLRCGGRPYLAGWYEFDAGLMRQLYGESYDTLLRLRAELDPGGRFNSTMLGPEESQQ